MDSKQVLEDLKNWLRMNVKYDNLLYPEDALDKILELEEEYE